MKKNYFHMANCLLYSITKEATVILLIYTETKQSFMDDWLILNM